ncbi:hypothetical protein SAY86_011590 [Trapa natans]|uniref:Phorbol-ester/DAG-type domain-containing protein n=1 Tax=Trapa natans TaxID=22666 RepID=A0AAN7R2Y2_TRANT|nr:hypothetical protein SAY86_011590 [Trapa natans]
MEILNHSSHEHPLVLCRTENERETCNLCSKKIDYVAFTCSECGFLLHKKCGTLPREMRHHLLHPQHLLLLVPNHPDSQKPFICSQCEQKNSPFVFRCSECDFNIDVTCFLRTQAATGLPSGQNPRKIHSHQHGLLLHYIGEDNSMVRRCSGCNMLVSGPTYYCIECPDFLLHKSCSQFAEQIQHPFHPKHPLSLLTKSPYRPGSLSCDACINKFSNGFVFHCGECKFDLDLNCASRVPSLRHDKHIEHPLDLFEETGREVVCSVCGKTCREHIYRCIACNFNAHDTCLPFPSTMKHKNHQHLLSLKKSIVKGDLVWFPCEVCKKRITPRHQVYYCEDCSYGVHIHCVDVEDTPALEADSAWTLEDIKNVQAEADALAVEMEAQLHALSEKLQSFFKKYLIQLNHKSEVKDKMTGQNLNHPKSK